jgi:hypothetical protein
MSTKTIRGYLYHVHYDFELQDEFRVLFNHSADMGKHSHEWTVIREHSFEVEVPDDFDPRPQQIASLEAQKQMVRAELGKRITEIEEQISRLQAIEYSGSDE